MVAEDAFDFSALPSHKIQVIDAGAFFFKIFGNFNKAGKVCFHI